MPPKIIQQPAQTSTSHQNDFKSTITSTRLSSPHPFSAACHPRFRSRLCCPAPQSSRRRPVLVNPNPRRPARTTSDIGQLRTEWISCQKANGNNRRDDKWLMKVLPSHFFNTLLISGIHKKQLTTWDQNRRSRNRRQY